MFRLIYFSELLENMSDSEHEQEPQQQVISPRKSVRRINQDLHCFVISDGINDHQSCKNIISNTMEALTRHGELANSVTQARK